MNGFFKDLFNSLMNQEIRKVLPTRSKGESKKQKHTQAFGDADMNVLIRAKLACGWGAWERSERELLYLYRTHVTSPDKSYFHWSVLFNFQSHKVAQKAMKSEDYRIK